MVVEDSVKNEFDKLAWTAQLKARRKVQEENRKFIADNPNFDDQKIRSLDSTLKKVTGFMKRVKNIGTTVTPESLIPDLSKLNLSKFVDEIAQCVVEAKMKVEELDSLIKFCVSASQIYSQFSVDLVTEVRKQMPTKRADSIKNPSKLRVDVKFLSDLILNGVLGMDGIKLLGQVLGFLIQTDKTEHLNISILMPFCRHSYFDCTGVSPLLFKHDSLDAYKTSVLSKEQKDAIIGLFSQYFTSLTEHLNTIRTKMNGILKFIKRQERTRGDASQEDRAKYDELKIHFDRLHQQALELAPWLSEVVPDMPEELSDDEEDHAEAKQLDVELAAGKQSLWPDDDTRFFYERIVNVEHATFLAAQNTLTHTDEPEDEVDDFIVDTVLESEVDNVNLEDLEAETEIEDEQEIEEELVEEEGEEQLVPQQQEATFAFSQHTSANMTVFLTKLSNAINKERIDSCAIEFISFFNRKGNRKKLIQHLLAAPLDRLDLLPFYARFMATIKPTVPDVPLQVSHGLLERFREFARKSLDKSKKTKDKSAPTLRSKSIDAKVHVSKYVAELVKFNILPKAEGLACLRSLLVDLRNYKVDMLAAMIESFGLYLYKSPESHAKMKVIITVLETKRSKIKDQRQKLLLENAYFSVLPSDEETVHLIRRPPLEEYISKSILSNGKPLKTLRRIDWENEEVRDFTLALLTNACVVPFAKLEKLAQIVSGMNDYQPWLGVFVVDEILEFIRLALEIDDPSMHQRLFSSVVYIGQLFNYTMCGTVVIFKVLYQLISFGITTAQGALQDCAVRIRRVRLAIELVKTVGEFFEEGKSKERMDCFLKYLLLFFYDTKQHWNHFAETFGEFPLDVEFEMERVLKTFRPKERVKFPKTLEDARSAVQKIQELYQDKADQFLKNAELIQEDVEPQQEEKPRRLFCITEEDDEEQAEMGSRNSVEPNHISPNQPTLSLQNPYDYDEEEEAQLHINKEDVITQEDEDFMKEFDRMMAETYQTNVIPKVPVVDLEVPPAARQKFERKITFAEDSRQPEQPKPLQMALLTKKGNRTVLKAVNLESSKSMQDAWREQKERQEQERREVKHITLKMDERQYQQQQAEQLAESLQAFRFSKPNNIEVEK